MRCIRGYNGAGGVYGASEGEGGSMWSVRGHKEGGGYVVRLRRKGKVCGASEGIWRIGGEGLGDVSRWRLEIILKKHCTCRKFKTKYRSCLI